MDILAVVLAIIVGFAAGAAGLGGNGTASTTQTQPIDTYSIRMCYNPEPNVKLTLTWPDNFTISDDRFLINPAQFPQSGPFPTPIGYPPDGPPLDTAYWEQYKTRLTPVPADAPKLTSIDTCQAMMFTDASGQQVTSRNYIRVRRNLRSASCKVDEMSGPYNATPDISCGSLYPENTSSWMGAQFTRGTCDFSPYPDLRKVAEINSAGQELEIFWVPVTHNVKCRFDPTRPNCTVDEPVTNFNLRDFIYVLNRRDAFDSANSSGCVVKWDAGSTDKNACSHYFDVYMAEDIYNEMQKVTLPVPTTFPDYEKYYFLKQVMENCQEQNIFMPLVDATLTLPPTFIEKAFVAGNFYLPQDGKLMPNPLNDFEVTNYTSFVLNTPIINPLTTSLSTQGMPPFQGYLNICVPPNNNNCYAPLGSISFKKSATETVIFNGFAHKDAPNTFLLKDQSGADANIYQYTITETTPPQNNLHAPALQLKSIDFVTENEWTWATPICKPAVYLYPQKETDLNIKLDIAGQLTASDPPFDAKEGWNVKASPDGKISVNDTSGGGIKKDYPYLYYEADIKGVDIPKEGWVIQNSNLKTQISKLMKEIGFNEKEIADFLDYWLPRLTDKPYYFVTLLSDNVVNGKEKLSFSTSPDTLIRVRFVFEGLNAPLSITAPKSIPHYQRNGFVVTDWGGALIGKSCSDVSVK